MSNPPLLGRSISSPATTASVRSQTKAGPVASIEYVSGACGTAHVEMFESTDDENRGGGVIRITIDDRGCSMVPTAINLDNGIELHLAGEFECLTLLNALAKVIADYHARPIKGN